MKKTDTFGIFFSKYFVFFRYLLGSYSVEIINLCNGFIFTLPEKLWNFQRISTSSDLTFQQMLNIQLIDLLTIFKLIIGHEAAEDKAIKQRVIESCKWRTLNKLLRGI